MQNHYNKYVLVLLFVISCTEHKESYYKTTYIDKTKIEASFGKDVSQVLLDHIYIVVDSVTYSQLTNNPSWQKTYASLDIGLPNFAPVNNSSTTCYLRGHKHYIEILSPNNKYNEPVGKSGIGFSLKNDAEHFHIDVKPKVKTSKASVLQAHENVSLSFNDEKHLWFKAFYTPSPGTALHTWYAFYNPVFLNNLYGKCHKDYSREAFLRSCYTSEKLFHGIREIHLSCTEEDYYRIAQELGHLKCKLLQKEGDILKIKSGDVTIKITPSITIEYSRISQIVCGLNYSDYSTADFGNLSITNSNMTSIWNLSEVHKNN